MTDNETLSPGARANLEFVSSMKTEHPELAEIIPEGCQDCSSAWREASQGRADKLQGCEGRKPETITSDFVGEYTVMLCHLPAAVK